MKPLISIILCSTLLLASNQPGTYTVKYSGGSLSYKSGENLKLSLGNEDIRLAGKKTDPDIIPVKSITDLSYGQEVHRRIGTAIGLAVISLGIGALMAFSKSKKHYIGLTWDDNGKKGGFAIQANKNEYRGVIAALEGVTGKKAVDTDAGKKP